MEDKQCKIHVTNLKKNFGKLEVLKDISVDVQEGEVVVLLGSCPEVVNPHFSVV